MMTASDWRQGLVHYNTALFPLQSVLMAVGAALTVLLLFRPGARSSTAMKACLSVSMLINGILFFIVLGTHLPSPLRFVQGGLFIAISLLPSYVFLTAIGYSARMQRVLQ